MKDRLFDSQLRLAKSEGRLVEERTTDYPRCNVCGGPVFPMQAGSRARSSVTLTETEKGRWFTPTCCSVCLI